MIVLRGHPFEWVVSAPTATTIGVFDGVHVGHRQVLGDLVESSGELIATAVTFEPHPLAVLAPDRAPLMLTDVDQRIAQFQALGVEVTGVLDFPEIRDLAPTEFAERVLVGALAAQRVVLGADFRFGRDRTGDVNFLRREGDRLGFVVEVVDMFGVLDGVVSSTRIRQTLSAGDVEGAAEMLARPYQLNGVVVEGDRRGRELGFPTANLEPEPNRVVPGNGVYAGWVQIGEESYPAVINIGVRPTFAGALRRIEAHLLGFQGELYGEELAIDFLVRIRDEQRFATTEALTGQISRDVATAGAILQPR